MICNATIAKPKLYIVLRIFAFTGISLLTSAATKQKLSFLNEENALIYI